VTADRPAAAFTSQTRKKGWYGLGTGLERFTEQEPERQMALLHDMYAHWPFFRSVLSNSEIALRQTDLNIARYYVEQLAAPKEPGLRILGLIEDEYRRTLAQLRRITGQGLLQRTEDRPLDRSIELKEPYLDPLNYIQVRLLSEYRQRLAQGSPEDTLDLFERAIVSSIEGIATGLGTTG
jgi:phosphoenolpyruvate carboxylase